jgi:cathepsin L
VEVQAKNETALMAAIATRPISLSVDASSNGWQLYAGGVYTAACKCNKLSCLDHAVGGVGYGTDAASGEDFWIVRNSWSKSWGEEGYIRIAKGAKYGPEGQCGIIQDNQWAEVSN